ncbi:S-methyl-5'-thioadenosine phosphorylase [Micromonospora sp. NBC_00898]|uniref:S-methyl-5'-thioadenosine phosphorylase n=1 Tax=Micromonospora sp. NBC_00898 TaxID=2975981 RepID=UPI00386D18E4|nr:S-methyl-5'-thioadenosine phosphorylase [Micromonospora sp. NBC_00898]
MGPTAELAVIGGSGLYALLDGATEHVLETPYGAPSDPVTIAEVGGRRVAFLPRHGRDHRYPPHLIPYRANLWALRSLGVRQVLAPCAVGGLRPELGPGTFVVPNQLIDRTSGRTQTYYDRGAVHVSFADPYCPTGRRTLLDAAAGRDVPAVDGGTVVVVEGPRFSTRAESRWFAAIGGSVVNMTGHPEAVLARELALCYTSIALVTDLDAGVESGESVTQEEVFRVFGENTDRLRGVLLDAVAALPAERDCPCGRALDGIKLPFPLP